jgi:hypothetical protein
VADYPGTGIDDPAGLAAGPDRALWFSNAANNSVGRIATTGRVKNFTGTGIKRPSEFATGPDGALRFANDKNTSIWRMSTTEMVTSYTGGGISHPWGIAAGPGQVLWFTNNGNSSTGNDGNSSIGWITTSWRGVLTATGAEIATHKQWIQSRVDLLVTVFFSWATTSAIGLSNLSATHAQVNGELWSVFHLSTWAVDVSPMIDSQHRDFTLRIV